MKHFSILAYLRTYFSKILFLSVWAFFTDLCALHLREIPLFRNEELRIECIAFPPISQCGK